MTKQELKVELFENESLNQKLKSKCGELAESVAATEEQVIAEYKKSFKQLEKTMPETDEQTLAENAWNQTVSKYSKSSAGSSFVGIILGMDRASDMVANLRSDKIDLWESKGQDALKSGDLQLIKKEGSDKFRKLKFHKGKDELVSKEIEELPEEAEQVASDKWVVPIRTEARWDGDDAVGTPIPKNDYMRNVFGICRPKDKTDQEYKPFMMRISGDLAESGDIPTQTPVKFNGYMKDQVVNRDGLEEKQMNHSQGTEFEVLEGDLDIDLERFMETSLDPYLRDVPGLDEFVDEQPQQGSYNHMVIAKGRVQNMRLEPNQNGNRGFVLQKSGGFSVPGQEENGLNSVYCVVPEHVDINFGEGSYAYVVGTSFRGDPPEDSNEETGDPLVMVRGLFVPDDKKLPMPSETEDVTEDDIDLGSSDDSSEEESDDSKGEFADDIGDDFEEDLDDNEW